MYALRDFWPGQTYQNSPTAAAGPGDTLHLAFFGEPRQGYWYPALYYACKPWEGPWSFLTEVYFDPQVGYDWPVLALTKDGCRHLFWDVNLDPDYEALPECLYYSHSRDGKNWAPARPFSHLLPEGPHDFPFPVVAAADTTGLLHAVWEYRTVKEMIYFYRCGREESWSEPTRLFSDSSRKARQVLTSDRDNRLHLLWVTIDEADPDLAVLRHAVGELLGSTAATSADRRTAEAELLIRVGAYPNPANDRMLLRLTPLMPCVVTAEIYDTSGRLVQRLTHEKLLTQQEELEWPARGDTGSFPSGVYFYRIFVHSATDRLSQQKVTGKMLLVR